MASLSSSHPTPWKPPLPPPLGQAGAFSCSCDVWSLSSGRAVLPTPDVKGSPQPGLCIFLTELGALQPLSPPPSCGTLSQGHFQGGGAPDLAEPAFLWWKFVALKPCSGRGCFSGTHRTQVALVVDCLPACSVQPSG